MTADPRRRGAALALACAAALAGAPARASNPESTPVSPESALTGGVVLASDDPGGGGWHNPASLGAVTRSSIQVGASAYALSGLRVDGAMVTALPWGEVEGSIRSVRYASVPSVISYSFRLDDGLGASLGVWTPFHDYSGGSTTGNSSGPYPGAPGLTGTYSQIYSLSATRDDTWAGAAMGWRASPTPRLGAMLQGAYSPRVWTRDLNASLSTDSTDPLQQGGHLAFSERGDYSYLAVRALVGVQWDATPAIRLAAAVRSPSVRVLPWGSVSRVTSAAVLLPGVPPTEYQAVEEVHPERGLSIVEPVRLYGGLRVVRGPWTWAAEADWHPALKREIGSYRSAWNARLGATWRLTPDLVAGGGLFRDTSSAVAATQGTASIDYYGLAGGLEYRPSAVVRALGGGTSWDLLTAIAVRGAYGTGVFPGIHFVPIDSQGLASTTFPAEVFSSQEVPARAFEGSLSFFTSIAF